MKEPSILSYVVVLAGQLTILYYIWKSLTTWSDDQSIEKKFRNSNKDKEK
tara:strand:- start:656 stop:805 length:150 start_codon:yes stop_codon:yes gene_type:complete